MESETARLRVKSWLCAIVVICSNAIGNVVMKYGMPAELHTPVEYITVLFRPWVALGVGLLILWTLSRMALLSWADLSYVLPVTSIGYVLVALMSHYILREPIAPTRWAGIIFIVAGVVMVGGGNPRTSTDAEARR
jgi:drug/metabolite transporter (DMT)-like permease